MTNRQVSVSFIQRMEETGTVVGFRGTQAEVEIPARGECSHCPAHSLCNWTGQKTRMILAANAVQARLGDRVLLSLSPKRKVSSNLLVFGIPTLGMLVGVLLGSLVFRTELWAGVLTGVGLTAGFLLVKLIDGLAGRSGKILPVVVKILREED